ncbi:hypothetical protein CMV30_03725 [Nibricoccus aquaticus]|uniref:DUF2934 domain-containing protein n=1 Tax=Nibricoccus aquaticus TaxID=2576891 RepID=A0A290Q388_9BACT|nr:hypothetical protein CMV30_03725 [Nibricoccus aquaticus]
MTFIPSEWSRPDPPAEEAGFSSHQDVKFPGLVSTDRAAHEEILHRAYSIWECAGRPENCEVAHWLQAEAEVVGAV